MRLTITSLVIICVHILFWSLGRRRRRSRYGKRMKKATNRLHITSFCLLFITFHWFQIDSQLTKQNQLRIITKQSHRGAYAFSIRLLFHNFQCIFELNIFRIVDIDWKWLCLHADYIHSYTLDFVAIFWSLAKNETEMFEIDNTKIVSSAFDSSISSDDNRNFRRKYFQFVYVCIQSACSSVRYSKNILFDQSIFLKNNFHDAMRRTTQIHYRLLKVITYFMTDK